MSEFNEKKKEILKETTFSFVNTFVQYSTRESKDQIRQKFE